MGGMNSRLLSGRLALLAIFVGGCAGATASWPQVSAPSPPAPAQSAVLHSAPPAWTQPAALHVRVLVNKRLRQLDDSSTLPKNGDCYTDGKRTIPVDAVSHLRELLLKSQTKDDFDPADLGITPESVRARQKEILEATLTNLSGEPELPVVNVVTYDDVVYMATIRMNPPHGPHFSRVSVTLDGPGGFIVESEGEDPLMLPWHVWMNGRHWDAYVPDVARAVAAMLPACEERDRAGDALHYWSDGFWHSKNWWAWAQWKFQQQQHSGSERRSP